MCLNFKKGDSIRLDTQPLIGRSEAWKLGKQENLIAKILSGTADANIAFTDLRNLLSNLGFAERIRGDHYIFTKTGIEEILNLQLKGSKAKAYQVKQVRDVLLKYGLGGQNDTSL